MSSYELFWMFRCLLLVSCHLPYHAFSEPFHFPFLVNRIFNSTWLLSNVQDALDGPGYPMFSGLCYYAHNVPCVPPQPVIADTKTPKPIVTAITITVTHHYSTTGSIEPKITMSSRRIALCLCGMLFFPALNFICLIQSVLAGWIEMGIVLELVICTYAVWPSPGTSFLSWISADWLHLCHPSLPSSWSLRQLTLIMQFSMPGLLHYQSTTN